DVNTPSRPPPHVEPQRVSLHQVHRGVTPADKSHSLSNAIAKRARAQPTNPPSLDAVLSARMASHGQCAQGQHSSLHVPRHQEARRLWLDARAEVGSVLTPYIFTIPDEGNINTPVAPLPSHSPYLPTGFARKFAWAAHEHDVLQPRVSGTLCQQLVNQEARPQGNQEAKHLDNQEMKQHGNQEAQQAGNLEAKQHGNSDRLQPGTHLRKQPLTQAAAGSEVMKQPGNQELKQPGNKDAKLQANLEITRPSTTEREGQGAMQQSNPDLKGSLGREFNKKEDEREVSEGNHGRQVSSVNRTHMNGPSGKRAASARIHGHARRPSLAYYEEQPFANSAGLIRVHVKVDSQQTSVPHKERTSGGTCLEDRGVWLETAAREACEWALRNRFEKLCSIVESPTKSPSSPGPRRLHASDKACVL
ncbi:MAG: hypothetical protein SGPRY_010333, partial [Prymnesium sp.]